MGAPLVTPLHTSFSGSANSAASASICPEPSESAVSNPDTSSSPRSNLETTIEAVQKVVKLEESELPLVHTEEVVESPEPYVDRELPEEVTVEPVALEVRAAPLAGPTGYGRRAGNAGTTDLNVGTVNHRLYQDHHEQFALSLCPLMERCPPHLTLDLRIDILKVIKEYIKRG